MEIFASFATSVINYNATKHTEYIDGAIENKLHSEC